MELPVKAVVLLSILSLHILPVDGQLWVASFNIQKLSVHKLNKPWVKDVIVQILCQYDIVFIQEIQPNMQFQRRTKLPQDEMGSLVHDMNALIGNGNCGSYSSQPFEVVVTDHPAPEKFLSNHQRDFRGTEMYAYIYRGVTLVHAYVYQPGPQQQPVNFFRPPYIASFQVNRPNIGLDQRMPTFTLIGLHAKPNNVPAELNALAQVYTDLDNRHTQDYSTHLNALILGDLNADGTYFSNKNALQCTLCKQLFTWLIPLQTNQYTNTIGTMAYDRFIAVGPEMSHCTMNARPAINTVNQVITTVRKAFPMQVRNLIQYHAVSDHYPIEVKLDCSQVPFNPHPPGGK